VQASGPIQNRFITTIRAQNSPNTSQYYFLIFNCQSDSAVKPDILERYHNLIGASYTAIIGLRDVYPAPCLPLLRQGLDYGMPSNPPIPIDIILAVMEVESWFIAEENHYPAIDPNLDHIIASQFAGFEVHVQTTETLVNPAKTLHDIYQQVGLSYRKRMNQIQRTVNALDYTNLYVNVRSRNNSLNDFITKLEGAIW